MICIMYNIYKSEISSFHKYLKLEKFFKYNIMQNKAINLFLYYYNLVFNRRFY